jgi:nitrous oxide reductase accessory protein NosL
MGEHLDSPFASRKDSEDFMKKHIEALSRRWEQRVVCGAAYDNVDAIPVLLSHQGCGRRCALGVHLKGGHMKLAGPMSERKPCQGGGRAAANF